MTTDRSDDATERPSKTAIKKRMLALQELGESLIDLPQKQYSALSLPKPLREAVDVARGMSKRGALHRQRQFIGRLMRNIDPEPIRAALEQLQSADRQAARIFHRVEALRERLIETDDDSEITAICSRYPMVDRQVLRQRARAARRERMTGTPAGAGRALFRFLDALLRESDQAP